MLNKGKKRPTIQEALSSLRKKSLQERLEIMKKAGLVTEEELARARARLAKKK